MEQPHLATPNLVDLPPIRLPTPLSPTLFTSPLLPVDHSLRSIRPRVHHLAHPMEGPVDASDMGLKLPSTVHLQRMTRFTRTKGLHATPMDSEGVERVPASPVLGNVWDDVYLSPRKDNAASSKAPGLRKRSMDQAPTVQPPSSHPKLPGSHGAHSSTTDSSPSSSYADKGIAGILSPRAATFSSDHGRKLPVLKAESNQTLMDSVHKLAQGKALTPRALPSSSTRPTSILGNIVNVTRVAPRSPSILSSPILINAVTDVRLPTTHRNSTPVALAVSVNVTKLHDVKQKPKLVGSILVDSSILRNDHVEPRTVAQAVPLNQALVGNHGIIPSAVLEPSRLASVVRLSSILPSTTTTPFSQATRSLPRPLLDAIVRATALSPRAIKASNARPSMNPIAKLLNIDHASKTSSSVKHDRHKSTPTPNHNLLDLSPTTTTRPSSVHTRPTSKGLLNPSPLLLHSPSPTSSSSPRLIEDLLSNDKSRHHKSKSSTRHSKSKSRQGSLDITRQQRRYAPYDGVMDESFKFIGSEKRDGMERGGMRDALGGILGVLGVGEEEQFGDAVENKFLHHTNVPRSQPQPHLISLPSSPHSTPDTLHYTAPPPPTPSYYKPSAAHYHVLPRRLSSLDPASMSASSGLGLELGLGVISPEFGGMGMGMGSPHESGSKMWRMENALEGLMEEAVELGVELEEDGDSEDDDYQDAEEEDEGAEEGLRIMERGLEIEIDTGLGIDAGLGIDTGYGSDGGQSEYFSDPPTPVLRPAHTKREAPTRLPVLPSLPLPTRSLPLSSLPLPPALIPAPTTMKKPTKFQSHSNARRVYPRLPSIDLVEHIGLAERVRDVLLRSPAQRLEAIFPTTPDLLGLPGAFIASPVLPTTFTDYGHSPLPIPHRRFARIKRNPEPDNPYPTPTTTVPGSPLLNVTTSTSCTTTSMAYSSSMPSSSLGTPTVGSSTMFSSPHFGDASDMETAPSTPNPDVRSHATPIVTASQTNVGSEPALLFDAAIATTVIGAIVCLGAVGWLVFVLVRRRRPRPNELRGIKGGWGDDDDHGSRREKGEIHQFPAPPPLARLSVATSAGEFERGFDEWIGEDDHIGDSTEDHGGYPESVRAASIRGLDRSDSKASRTSRDSRSTREVPRRRSSLGRASSISSFAESNFSRTSLAYSSRNSHGVGSAPPQLPSPVGVRFSGDQTPPETPVKRRGAPAEVEPPVPVLPADYRDYTPRSRTSSKSSVGRLISKSKIGRGAASTTRPDTPPETPEASRADRLAKRRATVDGASVEGMGFADSVHTLLFKTQMDGQMDTTDPFVEDEASFSHVSVNHVSIPVVSIEKKARPVTMPDLPPCIVISDHPQELVPPASPARARTPSVKDSRLSTKTFETIPWLSQSASATSALTNVLRDDNSIVDPDMRSQKHASRDSYTTGYTRASTRYSNDTYRYSTGSTVAARLSTDSDAIRQMVTAPFDSFAIGSYSDDDRNSIMSDLADLNTDDEQNLRTQRRRTLLYSVYSQKAGDGDDLKEGDAGEESLETLVAPSKAANQLRHSIVNDFPSPPSPIPSSPTKIIVDVPTVVEEEMESDELLDSSLTRFSKTSFDLDMNRFNLDHRLESSESIRSLARTPTSYDTMATGQTESDIASLFCSPDDADDFLPDRHSLPSAPISSTTAPPRPMKAATRIISGQYEASPILPSPTNFAPPPSQSRVRPTPPLGPVSPQIRSFADDLQDSVGAPATGYDSETLLSYNPSRTSYVGLGMSNSLYSSSQSASIESLEEAAISHAETVQIGSRRSVAGLSTYGAKGASGGGRRLPSSFRYDSDDSLWDESEGENVPPPSRMRGDERLSTVLEREEY